MASYCTNTDVIREAGLDSAALPSPLTTADVTSHIAEAQSVIDRMCNTTYGTTEVTEYYDGNNRESMYLRHYPVVSVSTLTVQGTTIDVTNDLYIYTGLEGGGEIRLHSDAAATTFKSTYPRGIVIKYTYGTASVPTIVKKACMNMAARMVLAQQIGGTYDDLATFGLPELSGSVGQAYINIREAWGRLQAAWESEILPYLPKAPAV